MSKLAKKLEEQLIQQELDEQGLSGKLYGVQEPKITKTKAKGRKVLVSAYMLVQAIKAAIRNREEHYATITLGEGKTLAIDLVTLEALYFNDKEVSMAELGEELLIFDTGTTKKEEFPVSLEADSEVTNGTIVKIFDVIRESGNCVINLRTTAEK